MSDADPARCPGPGVAELFAEDSRTVPPSLVADSWHDLGLDSIPADRYTSAAFFDAERTKMWPNVWQMAARDEELPEPGDLVVYNNVGRSYILIRQPDGSVRAFHNVCLHRGRKLRTESGHANELQCPFHGFTWSLDGDLSRIPCRWDFPHLDDAKMKLPQLRVGHFAGFIFVTENADQVPLEEFLGPLPKLFERWRIEECSTVLWVGKVINANWKVCAEAFMEAWHSVTTHPQILPFTGDANTRYSLWDDNVSLALTPFGVLSPHLEGKGMTEESVLAAMGLDSGRSGGSEGIVLTDGQTARSALAQKNRTNFVDDLGYDSADVTDSEVLDAYTYNVFPNLSPWGGFGPNVVYRWRPWPDQNSTLMEVRLLARPPKGQPKPLSAEMRFLGEDEPWTAVAEWGSLGAVFEQDMANLPFVQEGLIASPNNRVELGRYQESRIRQLHATLEKYLSGELPAKG